MWAERSERRGELFVDVVAPPPRLFIFGAVDFAGALFLLSRTTGWRPFIVDPRGRFATPSFSSKSVACTTRPSGSMAQRRCGGSCVAKASRLRAAPSNG